MKIFLCGFPSPTSLARYQDAEERVRTMYTPVNPIKAHDSSLKAQIYMLLDCEAIFLMHGWESDPGCQLLRSIAEALSFRVVNSRDPLQNELF